MTSRDFCYWLQGFFEIHGADSSSLTSKQVDMVQKHLALVFKHEIDPSYGDEKHQQLLNEIHNKIDKVDQKVEEVSNRPPAHVGPPVYRC